MDQGGSQPSMMFVVRWESALPVRQARMRAKYGSEVATSADAKKILEAAEPNYVITVSGLPPDSLRGNPEAVKKKVLADASLAVKGKDPLKPVDFILQRGDRGAIGVIVFPRTAPLSLEDKDVDF